MKCVLQFGLATMIQQYEVVFRGYVQGVGFRARVSKIARAFAVPGLIRNEPDGSVYLLVQADSGVYREFLASIHDVFGDNIRDTSEGTSEVTELHASFRIER